MSSGALSGLRVVDLSGITAGGRTTQLLGDFGAEVIKVEGPRRPDPFRHWTGVTGESGGDDLGSPPFRVVGRNKRGVAIDLKDPRGVATFRQLVETADLVVENFRRGVMEKLGIGFSVLRSWNARVVLLSISSQGDDGPERDFVSFGGTLEALSGLMSVTGYSPGEPVWTTSKVNFPDQVVALLAPGLAIDAVMRSRRTGAGTHVDLSQRESVVSLLGSLLAATAVTGTTPQPAGATSADETTLCCRCQGDDEWVVVTVGAAKEWQRLTDAIGRSDLRVDPRITEYSMRQRRADALVKEIEAWTARRTKHQAMVELQRRGLRAAAVLRAFELDAETPARGESFHVRVPTSAGTSEQQISWPFTIHSDNPPEVRRRAPHVGEHTGEVLTELGFTCDEVEKLHAAGVIAGNMTVGGSKSAKS